MVQGTKDFKIGMRDLGKPGGNLVQLYWDIILLMESRFILPEYRKEQRSLKIFQKHMVDKMAVTLNTMVKPVKAGNITGDVDGIGGVETPWRHLGVSYLMVYLPLYFTDVIWCKCDKFCLFHVILPQNNSSLSLRREWLLALLELSDKLGMRSMRLYIAREDFTGVSTFLRNLSWIGGKLVSNEDRTGIGALEPEDLILGDENYIILEFES